MASLLKEYGALFDRVAAAYEANFAIRQELTQEIVFHVWQSLKHFRGDSQLKTYVLKIAHNRGVQHVSKEVKRIQPELITEDSATVSGADYEAEQAQQLNILMKTIRELPLSQRQVATLYLEGLSYQEIAEVSGNTQSNVGVMINRIKTKLQEALNHANT
ncbi:MAG: sigma-70 family RNA polymerase sigma factor [Alteromonadaceae bacterium]|nr:sigma-70 family RNA polymerase sigma factor [Alteromonadaceae bacterium]